MESPRKGTETQKKTAEDKLFNFRPLFFSAVFLALGVCFGYLYIYYGISAWWACCLLPVAAMPFFFFKTSRKRKQAFFAILVLAVCFAIGAVSFCAQVRSFVDCGQYNGEYTVCGRVIGRTKSEEYCLVTLTDVYVGENKENGKLNAYLPASFFEECTLSDEVVLRGKVRTATELSNEYGFRANAIEDDVRFYMTSEDCVVTGHTFDFFLFLRSRMTDTVYTGLDETTASVTIAVLLGDTSGIESGLLENIRRGGIAHIFAVSGLHIGALFTFCLGTLKRKPFCKLSKLAKWLLTATLLVLYGGICGFSASVVRAIVTCLLFYASDQIGIAADSSENLGVAAFILLLGSPCTLFTVGFQLSFASCLGIAWISRPLSMRINKMFEDPRTLVFEKGEDAHPLTIGQSLRRGCISYLSVTVSAQLATAPILLSTFGYLSGWSLLLNCLFVPLIGVSFWILLLFVAFVCILPIGMNSILLYIPKLVWSALLLLFQTVDFSSFSLENVRFSFGTLVCYYALLTFLSDKWNIKKGFRILLFFLFLFVFLIGMYAMNA